MEATLSNAEIKVAIGGYELAYERCVLAQTRSNMELKNNRRRTDEVLLQFIALEGCVLPDPALKHPLEAVKQRL